MELREFLLHYFNGNAYRPMRAKKIAEQFGLSKEARADFYELIDDMLAKGEIRSTKKGRLRAAGKKNEKPMSASKDKKPKESGQWSKEPSAQAEKKGKQRASEPVISSASPVAVRSEEKAGPGEEDGVLQGNAKGFAFFVPDTPGKENLFISASDRKGALHGDRVRICRIRSEHPSSKRSSSGRVVQILERNQSALVGTYRKAHGQGMVEVDSKNYSLPIQIAAADTKGATPEDKVVVEIVEYPQGSENPRGRIVEVLGRRGDKGVDITSVARTFALPYRFHDDCLAEAGQLPDAVAPEDLRGRKDFRNLFTVTIDGADAKDFDDAISIEKKGRFYNLYVHIADVSHYVREGSALDRDAYERGNSVYLLDRVIPMLPEKLSNGLCSLNPQEDRLAITTRMTLDAEGDVLDYRFFRSVIRSDYRLVYEEVSAYLEEGHRFTEDRKLFARLDEMAELYRILAKKRIERGTLDFDLPETNVELNAAGEPAAIGQRERRIANRLIEEFMILNNEVVGTHFYRKKLPFLYRTHTAPSEEKRERLNAALYAFRYDPLPETVRPGDLRRILTEAEGTKEERILNMLVLGSMSKAVYRAVSRGHFGLAIEHYSHFTSPIRRYADLVAHRLLKQLLQEGATSAPLSVAKLEEIGKHVSETEIKAEDAERDVVEMKCAEYMQQHIGEVWTGVVSGLTNFGVFLTLENSVTGLAHFRDMQDDYYTYDPVKFLVKGERSGKKIRYGDEFPVLITRSNPELREIDFQIQWPKEEAAPQRGKPKGVGAPAKLRSKAHAGRAKESRQPSTRGATFSKSFRERVGKKPKNWKGASLASSARPRSKKEMTAQRFGENKPGRRRGNE